MLSNPVISEKCREWQAALSELRSKKVVQVDEKFRDMAPEKTPGMVRFRSNFATIAEAKTGLTEAIRGLRDLRQQPLAKVHEYIEAVEAKMKKLDFSVLKESDQPVTEARYRELIAAAEVEVRPALGSTDRFAERFFKADHFTRA
jgi:hypothetical protein